MESEFKTEFIDGKFINLDKLSIDELKKLKAEYEEKEKQIIKKIDDALKED